MISQSPLTGFEVVQAVIDALDLPPELQVTSVKLDADCRNLTTLQINLVLTAEEFAAITKQIAKVRDVKPA